MSKTSHFAKVDSGDTCFVNGYKEATDRRIRLDNYSKPYIKLLGERIDLTTSPMQVKLEFGKFTIKFDTASVGEVVAA